MFGHTPGTIYRPGLLVGCQFVGIAVIADGYWIFEAAGMTATHDAHAPGPHVNTLRSRYVALSVEG